MKRKIFLPDFDMNNKTGFLPLASRTNALIDYECSKAVQDLPNLLMTGKIRTIIEGLDNEWVFDGVSDKYLEEAMQCFSYLGHAYVWGEEGPVDHIPANLARPWFQVASQLGRPPVLSYASYSLYNWRLMDKSKPHTLDNIMVIQDFLGGQDEKWFIKIHVAIEAAAGPVIGNLINAHNFLNMEEIPNEGLMNECLMTAEHGLRDMLAILKRTPEFCDPFIYYNRVRPYIHGWMSSDPEFPYPDGLEYQGVDVLAGKKMQFRGETGAQSTIIPLLDALFSIKHDNDMLKEYLLEMRYYHPKKHRKIIEEVEKYPSIRKYASTMKSCKLLMDNCIRLMNDFRTYHLELAATYIHQQANADGGANSTAIGTGGTPFMKYLKKHRDETV